MPSDDGFTLLIAFSDEVVNTLAVTNTSLKKLTGI
jgi:hypothetical protein